MARQIVGEIFLNVKPLDGGVTPGVQKIIDQASTSGVEIPVDAETEQARQEVARLSAQIEDDVGGAWLAATAQAAAFTAAVIGAKRQIQGTVAQLAGLFDQLAQAQAGFTAILGSESAGNQLLDEIREFARVTPFVTQELVNYSQQLLGVGQSAESIVPLLGSVGDVIASVGGDTQNISRVLFTLTQIRSVGRLIGQDAIQLQSSLIPITKILADFLDITQQEVKKLQEQGAISADTVFAAITSAGERVEGAMLTATRNISGAQAVISDSIEILLQESLFLQEVFQDIVEGILAFDEALGSEEAGGIKQTVDSISESLLSLYTDLKPAIEGFVQVGAGLAVNSIQVLASALEILAAAVASVPAPALEQIGRALAIYAALRAPIALINYVNTLRALASQITPEKMVNRLTKTADGIDATGDAGQQAAPKITRIQEATQKYALAASAAALATGTLIRALANGNDTAETFGSTLQGLGVGAQLGSVFGPTGTLVGAAAGAGVGFVSSFVTNAREEAERSAAELAEIGDEAATAFLEAFALRIVGGIDTAGEFSQFFTEIEDFQALVNEYDSLLAERSRLEKELQAFTAVPTIEDGRLVEPDDSGIAELEAQIAALNTEIDNTAPGAKEAQAQLNALFSEGQFSEAITDLQNKLGALNKESPELAANIDEVLNPNGGIFENVLERARGRLLGTGQAAAGTSEDFALLDEVLQGVGLTVDQVLNSDVSELATILNTEATPAIVEMRAELDVTNKAFEEAKKGVSEYFSVFSAQVSSAKQAVEQSSKLAATQQKLVEEGLGTASGFEYAEQLISIVEALSLANQTITDDPQAGNAEGLSFLLTTLVDLQEELELTDQDFESFLESVGLLDLYLSADDVAEGFIGSIQELSEQLGVSEQDIRNLFNISDELAESNPTITVTADTISALNSIEALKNGIDDPDALLAAEELEARLESILGLGGGFRIAAGDVEESVDSIVGSLQRYSTAIQQVQSRFTQGRGLGDAFEQIQATGEGNEAFAKQLIDNFQSIAAASVQVFEDEERALNDGLSFVRSTLQGLQEELGITDEEFLDLLDTMGLYQIFVDSQGATGGFLGSIDELIATTGIAEETLREVLSISEQLAGETQIVVTADTTQALEELAELKDAYAIGGFDLASGQEFAEQAREIRDVLAEGGAVRVIESDVLEEAQAAAEEERRRAQEEAERERERAEREAERALREQEKLLQEQERILESYESANDTIANAMQQAADQIEAAAQQWTADIRDRVEQERAVPIERLLRNASEQTANVAFIDQALQQLQARGLSEDAISAIGISGQGSVRQLQRLLGASDTQLQQLSGLVGERDANAEVIAQRQQRAETQATIVAAIVQAAQILGVDIGADQAARVAATFNIGATTTSADLPPDFVETLLNIGQLVRA